MSTKLIDRIAEGALPVLEAAGYDLADLELVKEGANWYLRFYIDSPEGGDFDDCEKASGLLSDWLDETDPIPQAYFLEVSSPGIERVLKKEKDFIRSMGKDVDVRLYRQIDKQKEFTGALSAYDENTVTLTMEDGSKMVFEKPDIALIRLALDF